MTDEEIRRIEHIEGQIAAIGLTLNLIVETHTDPSGFRDAIRSRSERMQARLLASHVPDAVLAGAEAFVHQWLVKPPPSGSETPVAT